jgi:hypothetical protein
MLRAIPPVTQGINPITYEDINMAKIAKKSVIVEGNEALGARIDFTDGRKVSVMFRDLSQEMVMRLAGHGLLQKLGDSYSSAQGDVDFAFAKASAVAESLLAGDWNMRGDGMSTDLATALAEVAGRELEEAIELLGKMDKEQREALGKRADIKAVMLRLKAERAAAKAEGNTDDLSDLFA